MTPAKRRWAQRGPDRGTAVSAVRILRLAAGGDGVGKLEDGRTVFVPRTAPGDLVELTGLRAHKRFARARLGRAARAVAATGSSPRCPHYVHDECGGCQLQHLDAERPARGASRLRGRRAPPAGAKRDVPDPPIVPAERDFDYRTKITLARERRRATDRAASATTAPTRSSTWTGATSPCPS